MVSSFTRFVLAVVGVVCFPVGFVLVLLFLGFLGLFDWFLGFGYLFRLETESNPGNRLQQVSV